MSVSTARYITTHDHHDHLVIDTEYSTVIAKCYAKTHANRIADLYNASVVESDWPDGFEMVRRLRDDLGLFSGAMPITPQQAWEHALDLVRHHRRLLAEVHQRVPYDVDPELLDLVGRAVDVDGSSVSDAPRG